MREKNDQANQFLLNTIDRSDNHEYKTVMTDIVTAIGTERAYKIINNNNLQLDTSDAKVKSDIVKTFVWHLSEDDYRKYISNMFKSWRLNFTNLYQFLQVNEKSLFQTLSALCNLCQFSLWQYPNLEPQIYSFLSESLKDPELEKKLIDIAETEDKRIYWFIINGYLSNNEIEKALTLHKDKWITYELNLHPLKLLNRLIELWGIDTAINYLLENDKLRDEFNGSSNKQYRNLSKFFIILLEIDKSKAIEFVSHPKIAQIQHNLTDAKRLIEIMIEENIEEDLVFKYITSPGISDLKYINFAETDLKYVRAVFCESFAKIWNSYWANFLKKIIMHEDWKWWNILVLSDKYDAETILERVSDAHGNYALSMIDL